MKRQRLGQHYLTDDSLVERMVREARIRQGDIVLEIGSGRGVLTSALAGVTSKLIAYEIDPANVEATRLRVGTKNIKVIEGDAFEADLTFDVVCSSLPYSRSSQFVEWICQSEFRRGVVILQKDFVSKLLAHPGTRSYRAISVIAQASLRLKVIYEVPRNLFNPPPRVDSVLVEVLPRRKLTAAEVSGIKQLFSLRRKTLGSSMRSLDLDVGSDLAQRRIYSLSPDEVLNLLS